MSNRILVIEDNKIISQTIVSVLSKEGYEVFLCETGEMGIRTFFNGQFDLVILDLLLPNLAGDEVMKQLRAKSQVPIIIISSKDSDVDKAIHLSLGADDYLSKPFSMIELIARVKAVLRRSQRQTEQPKIVKIGSLTVDLGNYDAYRDGRPLNLTLKEFLILKLFVTNPNHVFSKEQIYLRVWNETYFLNDNVINVHIRRLREKIEENPSKPKIIKTIWGIGYKYEE